MKKRICLFAAFCCLLLGNSGFAQVWCNDTILIMDRKGKWAHSTDVIHDREISAAEKKEVFKWIETLFEFVREAYSQPIGCEASWYRFVEQRKYKSPVPGGPQPYSLQTHFLQYYCDYRYIKDKGLLLSDASNTWVNIIVNQLSMLLGKYQMMEIDGKEIQTYRMSTKAGEINGIPYYWNSSYSPAFKILLFTRGGETFFTPITRRQYLEWYIKDKEKRNTESEDRIMKTKIRPAAEQEAEKQKELEKIDRVYAKYSDVKREAARRQYLNGYRTDEQRRDENLKRVKEIHAKELKKYSDELSNSDAATLEKPAYFGCSPAIFCDEEVKGGWSLGIFNESYFKKNLPPHQPQVIAMHLDYNIRHIADRHLNNEIITRFPFQKLQAMIK